MTENTHDIENQAEHNPNEREVLNIFEGIIGTDYEVLRSLDDEQGLYMLEVRVKGDDGDWIQYNYIKAGKYPEGSSSETVIDVIFFDGDMPAGGHPISKYVNGEWVQESDDNNVEQSLDNTVELPTEESIKSILAEMRALDALRPRSPEEAAIEKSRAELVESAGYVVEVNDGKWLTLSKNGYTIQLKHFVEPSEFGYKGGKISAIEVKKGTNVNVEYIMWDQDIGYKDGEISATDEDAEYIIWAGHIGTEVPQDDSEASAIFHELISILN